MTASEYSWARFAALCPPRTPAIAVLWLDPPRSQTQCLRGPCPIRIPKIESEDYGNSKSHKSNWRRPCGYNDRDSSGSTNGLRLRRRAVKPCHGERLVRGSGLRHACFRACQDFKTPSQRPFES